MIKGAPAMPTSTVKTQRTKPPVDLREQVHRRAYELYEQRGREDGHELGRLAASRIGSGSEENQDSSGIRHKLGRSYVLQTINNPPRISRMGGLRG